MELTKKEISNAIQRLNTGEYEATVRGFHFFTDRSYLYEEDDATRNAARAVDDVTRDATRNAARAVDDVTRDATRNAARAVDDVTRDASKNK